MNHVVRETCRDLLPVPPLSPSVPLLSPLSIFRGGQWFSVFFPTFFFSVVLYLILSSKFFNKKIYIFNCPPCPPLLWVWSMCRKSRRSHKKVCLDKSDKSGLLPPGGTQIWLVRGGQGDNQNFSDTFPVFSCACTKKVPM